MTPRLTEVQREKIHATLKAMAEVAAITPARVVAAAQAKNSPLHCCFEWNDKKAGLAYRLDQARALIRSVEVTVLIEERPVDVCYFVRDQQKERKEQGYITLDQLRQDPAQAKKHLEAELAAVLACLRRAEGYARVLSMAESLEQARSAIRQLAAKIETQPLQ